ncbi:MAG: Mur ligase family protein, partial [bacterium]
MDESHYQKALDYLYSFVDHSMTRALRYSPEKFNLDRMVNLARICGNPQCAYPTVHIAGTKGKGSTAAMIASCLMAAGYRVGLYTSPHLTEYTERIQVNGVEISKDDLAALVDWIKPYASQVPEITTFELTTMLGFEFFELQHVDIAVIEVGLGGRLDATNIIDPLVSVITSLSLDHINVLGDTLEKIAYEKAGIVKSGRPVVLSPQLENARKVVAQVCYERNARLFQAGSDFTGSIITTSLTHQEILLKNTAVSGFPKYQKRGLKVRLPLLGSHQLDNAVTAFGALQIIGEHGIKVNSQQFKQGYSTVHWPGRFEILQESP